MHKGATGVTKWHASTIDKMIRNCIASEEGMKQLVNHSTQKKLLKRIEELEKENKFLKKAAAFFAKEID